MYDHTLERKVLDALAADPRIDDETIAVECFGHDHVVLRGSASSPVAATRAVRAAYEVTGVLDVEDRLRLHRRGVRYRQDARTEAAVLRALIAGHTLPTDAMDVRAADGTVTLKGSVDFPRQRNEAEEIAIGVPGVSQLRNQLSVWIAVSPNEVLEQVSGAIGVDAAERLTVTARDNVVTLSGTARSAADRDAALAAAAGAPSVAGVEDEISVVA
jgi:osmotically-inducible protein OsmY